MCSGTGSISALYRHRRRHVLCAGMGVPVLKMTASEHTRAIDMPSAMPIGACTQAAVDAGVRATGDQAAFAEIAKSVSDAAAAKSSRASAGGAITIQATI